MAGSRRGPRYGHSRVDPNSPDRRIGDHLRELRIRTGMRLKDLAKAMRGAGFDRWNEDVASATQTGRKQIIRPEELPAIADLFGVTVDQFLRDSLGEVPGTINAARLHPADLLILAQMLDTTVDKLLADALDAQPPRSNIRAARLDKKPVKWTLDMPPFAGYEGQPEELNKIARELDVSRNELCRRVLQGYIDRYREQH